MTPIRVLLDMDVRTKSTYRATLEGLDMAMVETLSRLKYDPYASNPTIALHRQPTDIRLAAVQSRLEAFLENKEIGLCDFVKHARTIMYDFLDVIKLGFLNDLTMCDSGIFHIDISCMLHESGLEHSTSTAKKFENQIKHLTNFNLMDIEKVGNTRSYRFKDTDNNRNAIRTLLEERGARMIDVKSIGHYIDYVSFELDPKNLHKFSENPIDYSLPITEDLNDDEMIKLKKLVSEIPSSLAFINKSPDMLQTCGFVAESSFAEIEGICAFEGKILKRVRERHAKERAANMNIHEIEKEIGSQFPIEIARDVMEKIAAAMAYFCVENLHATSRNLQIDQWGNVKMDIKINQRSEDLMYAYYWGDKYKEPHIPDMTLMEDVFDMVKNRNGGIRLIDNENNRNEIVKIVRSVCGLDVDSISIARDDCCITRTRYDEEETCLENIFVVDQISVSTDGIEGILKQHDLCKMRKDGQR